MKLELKQNRKRTRETAQDIDYTDQLTIVERQWLETFVDGVYGLDPDALRFLTSSMRDDTKETFTRDCVAGNNAFYRDTANRSSRISLSPDDDSEFAEGFDLSAGPSSEDFQYYRCDRCTKRGDECKCVAKRPQPYGPSSYSPADVSTEERMVDMLDQRAKAFDLLPYGTSPDLEPGHKVVVCLPQHYLKDVTGTVRSYKRPDGAYLVEADKPGLKGDASKGDRQYPTTFAWVPATGLSKAQAVVLKR